MNKESRERSGVSLSLEPKRPIEGQPEHQRDHAGRLQHPETTPGCCILWDFIETELQVRGLSLNALCQATGIARQTFRRYQEGKSRSINERILQRLCDQFDWWSTDAVREAIAEEKDLEAELGRVHRTTTGMRLSHPRYEAIRRLNATNDES